MATTETQEPVAMAPSSTSTTGCPPYDLFLSFRGKDTGKNFTDHLYAALVGQGFVVFRDRDEIEKGERSWSKITKAINNSQMFILVISRNYADSPWCLDELQMIMKLHNPRPPAPRHVLPVFYHVDPSHVSDQTEDFGKAFEISKRAHAQEEEDRVKEWEEALSDVADVGGVVITQVCFEAESIQDIVRVVGERVAKLKRLDVPSLVGRESELERINLWLKERSSNVGMAVISGMAGVGKTAIAKTIYNIHIDRFDGSCFLGDVSKKLKGSDGKRELRKSLLLDVLKQKPGITGRCSGDENIKDMIRFKRVLLILDDVADVSQFHDIIGGDTGDSFCPGSKIIITTRNKRLVVTKGAQINFEIKKLKYEESLKLFSVHAFGQPCPEPDYDAYSGEIVRYCDGLPLALEELGKYLYNQGKKRIWESALQKWQDFPYQRIFDCLVASYTILPEPHKKLFLDIACFLCGFDCSYAVNILDGCEDTSSTDEIETLEDTYLVTISEKKKLLMHRLIRDMGRYVVYNESPNRPENRSRVWKRKDAEAVLKKGTGTESIRGLSMFMNNELATEQSPRRGNCKERCGIDSNCTPKTFRTETFQRMKNLELLNLWNVGLGEYSDDHIPRSFVWLSWHGFSGDFIPNQVPLENLAVLDMRCTNLKCIWENNSRDLEQLKILDLRHSHEIRITPNFRGLPKLEVLVLKGCQGLAEIDNSIGDLEKLRSLNVRDCTNLKKLPVNTINISQSLERLNVSGCKDLKMMWPEFLSEFRSLKVLKANEIDFNRLLGAESSEKISKLELLPASLEKLYLKNCGLSLPTDPKSILPSLKYWNVDGNKLLEEALLGEHDRRTMQPMRLGESQRDERSSSPILNNLAVV